MKPSAFSSRPAVPVPLAIVDDLIRRGRFEPAKAALRKFCKARVPRELRATAASFASRLELPDLGLKLLHPVVRPGRALPPGGPASPTEIAEYASCLTRLGAGREAIDLLTRREVKALPLAKRLHAFALIGVWDYEGAIPLLRDYLSTPGLSPYDQCIAETNLAIALVFESRLEEAEPLLTSLEKKSKAHRYVLLYANARKVRAQAALEQGDWAAAAGFLNECEKLMLESGRLDRLFLDKWRAALLVRERPKEGIRALEKVREQAWKAKHWETARDCTGRIAVAKGDEAAVWQLYFGTPYESYRKKLLRELGFKGSPPSEYLRKGAGKKILDLTGKAALGAGLEPSGTSFRLLNALVSDTFRPFRIGALFQILHPDEHFNPETAPVRVRVALSRLRRALSKRDFRSELKREPDGFRLSLVGSLRIGRSPMGAAAPESVADRARRHFGGAAFSVSECAARIGVPARTVSRALHEAVEAGAAAKLGRGPTTRYRFSK